MFGKKRANTKLSNKDLTSEVKLEVKISLRYIFAEKKKNTNETKENKEFLFCKCLTVDLMALPTKYEILMAKNEIRNVSFKYHNGNLRRSAVSSAESRYINPS